MALSIIFTLFFYVVFFRVHKYLFLLFLRDILVILQAAWVLAVLVHPSHIVIYAPRDSLSCRLQATRII
ncbi:hypothetical protein C9426_29165 [Serratia sp. S1B]|nr:hypothetical protein C9426_29165 [Serratia sp. S1B]